MIERECPVCGSHDVRIDPTTSFGYYCADCEEWWEETPTED